MSNSLEIVSVNTSAEKGTIKTPQPSVCVDALGIQGDAHAGPWHRQVSVLGVESIERFAAQSNIALRPGAFGENLTVRGLPANGAVLLDRFALGGVELEVTQIGKECHGAGCAIFHQVGKCVMPAEGLFCRVLQGGQLRPGQRGRYFPRNLRVWIVTLSDRAAAGVYRDRSGPRIVELMRQFCAEHRWEVEFETALLPDDSEQLRLKIAAAAAANADAIFTTGGTGVGPRDITPEVVAPLCEKLIPGIMENIRLKFGADHPNALLSRSIAGVIGRTQIYTLPGSVRAVEQYLGEILKTLEHLVFTLRGIDAHH
ncbi:MAG: molybdenum cofactor synthesis protein [Pirellulales bacterium]|nr:molybdenum cofactor synthesis protein [Pirellulales bacterium]